MTPKTLRKERIQKFREIIVKNKITSETGIESDFWQSVLCELADAAESRSERKTDETKGDYIPHGTAYNRGEQERPDKVAEMLAMMNFPGAKKNARIEALQSAFGVAFVVNSESKEWREFAKYAIEKQDSYGWKPETFITWVKQQKGYPDYWSCKRMRENYPKAFIQETQEEKVKLL